MVERQLRVDKYIGNLFMRSFVINMGILLMLLTAFTQSMMSAVVKDISMVTSLTSQVLFYYCIPLLFMFLFVIKNGFKFYQTEKITLYLLRSFFAVISVFCFFYAARNIQLGLAALLFNTIPIFVPLMARFFLKEKVTLKIYFGVILSMIGVMVILNPKFSHINYVGFSIGLLSGFFMAIATVIMKYLVTKKEPISRIVFYLYFFSSIITAVILLINILLNYKYRMLNISADFHLTGILLFLLILGILSITAQSAFTKAGQYLMASKLAPFFYVSVPISALIGWIFWRQKFTTFMIVGAVLVFIGICVVTFESPKKLLVETV